MVRQERFRLWVASAAISAWLFLLLVGLVMGGATHLLLLLALLTWPWRSSTSSHQANDDQERPVDPESPGGSSASADHRSGSL